MSYLWTFHSFDAERLSALFADPLGQAVGRLRELVRSPEAGFRDPDTADLVVEALVASGLSYENLDQRQARVADEIIGLIFSPEGFAADLDMVSLSDEGVHHGELKELMQRNPQATLLTILVRSGRRAGQDQPVQCEYCILEPSEVSAMIDEVQTAIAQPVEWSDEWRLANTQEFLLAPLAAASSRWVYGHLG